MATDVGRVGDADQALVASDGAATHLHPAGFDPSREDELLAEIERLRRVLQPVRQHGEIERIKRAVAGEPKVLAYVNELEALVRYHQRNADVWRGIASAMGYEPNAHDNVKPTTAWLRSRIAKYRAAIAMEAASAGETEGLDGNRDSAGLKGIAQTQSDEGMQ